MSEGKMVPVKPTEAMNYAGATEIHKDQSAAEVYNAMLAAAPAPAFDEAAERAAFEEFIEKGALEAGENEPSFSRTDFEGVSIYINPHVQGAWFGYLACAKRKAGVE